MMLSSTDNPPGVSFREALRFWLQLGFISFGGPAGQIAIMHRELVEKRRWISERRFLHAPFGNPAALFHQFAVHDGDLTSRPRSEERRVGKEC